MRVFWFLAVCFAVFSSTSVAAKDYVVSNGKLSDRDFYRLVACAAAPKQSCKRAMIHWPKPVLTVDFVEIDKRLESSRISISERALQNAISEINRAGAGIKLVRAINQKPDIRIHLTAGRKVDRHALVRQVTRTVGPRAIGITRIFFENYRITKALVVIAAENRKEELTSVMLEEITQSLGLPTDIRNRHYHARSIFSESGNRTVRLQGQDVKALHLHYPI